MDGKTKVRLEQDGSVLIVDEAATEPANHPEQGTGQNDMSKFQNCTLHLRQIGDRHQIWNLKMTPDMKKMLNKRCSSAIDEK